MVASRSASGNAEILKRDDAVCARARRCDRAVEISVPGIAAETLVRAVAGQQHLDAGVARRLGHGENAEAGRHRERLIAVPAKRVELVPKTTGR